VGLEIQSLKGKNLPPKPDPSSRPKICLEVKNVFGSTHFSNWVQLPFCAFPKFCQRPIAKLKTWLQTQLPRFPVLDGPHQFRLTKPFPNDPHRSISALKKPPEDETNRILIPWSKNRQV